MTTFVAISFSWQYGGYWGRGESESIAIENLRAAGGIKQKTPNIIVWKVEHKDEIDKPSVDDSGAMCWYGNRRKIAEYDKKGNRTELV